MNPSMEQQPAVQETPNTEGTHPVLTPLLQPLGPRLSGIFEEWKQARRPQEDEWLIDLRAFSSQYDQATLSGMDEDRSKVFVSLTYTKTMAAYSRVIDMVFSSSIPPWSVKPTPVPTVAPNENDAALIMQAQQELQAQIESGQIPENVDIGMLLQQKAVEMKQVIEQEHLKRARDAAEKMTEQISDQLTECGFENHAKRSILDCCVMGSGTIKGASLKIDKQSAWASMDGEWMPGMMEKLAPTTAYRSIFDIYPDPRSEDLNNISGIFDRHLMTKSEFRALRNSKMFGKAKIENIIRLKPNGNHSELPHEIERRAIGHLELSTSSNLYEVLEYWGMIDGKDLQLCGCEVEDPNIEYRANIWICDGEVIGAKLNQDLSGKNHPYRIYPYAKIPHKLWGIGPPRMMRDSQATINAAGRMMQDNLAITAGPQIEVNKDMLAPGCDPTRIHPFKIWEREGGDPSTPMVRVYNPQNNAAVMSSVMNVWREYADEETGIPRYMHGEKAGATRTSSGMSMLMGAAVLTIKSVIKNLDDYLFEPLIHSFYDWNMRWSEREEIKGDMRAVAQGSTSVMAREMQTERMIQFADMVSRNEAFAAKADFDAILGEIARSMELPVDRILKMTEEPSEMEVLQQEIQKAKATLDLELDKAKIGKLQAESNRANADAETIGMLREAESQKDISVAQRAVADISLQQQQDVAPPPLPESMGGPPSEELQQPQQSQQQPPNRDVSSQMQFA